MPIKKIYTRKCVYSKCKVKFTPTSNTQTAHSMECAIKHAKELAEKKKLKISLLEKQKLKKALTGLPELKKLLETQINTICRLLDKGSGCISCGGHTTPQSGHYHSVQKNGSIRFNLFNVHLQDYNCNCAKGGNLHQYDLGLIKMYGKEYWEYVKFELPLKYPVLKLTVPEITEAIQRAKEITKRLKEADITYSMEQRKRLRHEYNEYIGIYKD
jgi:hypothetical protein